MFNFKCSRFPVVKLTYLGLLLLKKFFTHADCVACSNLLKLVFALLFLIAWRKYNRGYPDQEFIPKCLFHIKQQIKESKGLSNTCCKLNTKIFKTHFYFQ